MFTLTILTGNAAFDPAAGGAHSELPRLLRKAADKVTDGQTEGVLVDANGNVVGEFSLSEPLP